MKQLFIIHLKLAFGTTRIFTISEMDHISIYFVDIWEKVFVFVDHKTILQCKLVCKSWNTILDNPSFWLKKLKIVGLPLEVYTKWTKIQNKFEEFGISKGEITKALKKSYVQFMTKEVNTLGSSFVSNDESLMKSWLSRPPIVVACTLGLLDMVKVLAELNVNFDAKYPDTFYSSFARTNFIELPIFFAMLQKHFEIVDFILTKMTTPKTEIRRINGMSLFHAAADTGHLNLVKRLLPLVEDVDELWECDSALHCAIRWNNNRVVEFLAPFSDVNVSPLILSLPLQLAAIYDNSAAVKILVPFTNNHNLQKVMRNPFTSIELKQIIKEEIIKRGI